MPGKKNPIQRRTGRAAHSERLDNRTWCLFSTTKWICISAAHPGIQDALAELRRVAFVFTLLMFWTTAQHACTFLCWALGARACPRDPELQEFSTSGCGTDSFRNRSTQLRSRSMPSVRSRVSSKSGVGNEPLLDACRTEVRTKSKRGCAGRRQKVESIVRPRSASPPSAAV